MNVGEEPEITAGIGKREMFRRQGLLWTQTKRSLHYRNVAKNRGCIGNKDVTADHVERPSRRIYENCMLSHPRQKHHANVEK